MKLTVGGVERRARSTSSYRFRMTEASFALVTTIPGVSIDRIATVSSGDTTATGRPPPASARSHRTPG